MRSVKIGRLITGYAIRIAVGLRLSVPLLLAGPVAFGALDVGPAANFAVFQMGHALGGTGKWTSSDVTINGNVAFNDTSPGGNANTIVNGNVEDPNLSPPNWTVNGTFQDVGSILNAFANQARAFSAAAAALTSPGIGAVNGAATYIFTAANLSEPGTYVVSTPSIVLNGGQDLILNGSALPAGSRVIVNVASDFRLNGGSSIILSGLTAAQVLINYTGTQDAHVTGGSDFNGTLLAPDSTAAFNSAGSVIDGSVIAESVNFSSHVTINGISFVPEPSSCIAGALLLLPFGASALQIARRR